MDYDEVLRREIEIINSRLSGEIAVTNERLRAVKETAAVLLPELHRRLEDLNNAAARRAAQEITDRAAFITQETFKDHLLENVTWRDSINKQMDDLKATQDRMLGEKAARQWLPIALTGTIVGLISLLLAGLARLYHF